MHGGKICFAFIHSFTNKRLFTVWKVCKYRAFSGHYFLVLGLNLEIHGVNFHIQSKSKSPHSVQTQENMNQKKLLICTVLSL